MWHKRSLQQFADQPLEELTKEYDLLIIDHPWVGCAATEKCVLALEKYLPKNYLNELRVHSVGASHESYFYDGSQLALSIDAATPTASYRPDLFRQGQQSPPFTWKDVMKLALEGKVALPAIPIDLLMTFYSFCIAHGHEPFQNKQEVIKKTVGEKALKAMHSLYSVLDSIFFTSNPIAVAELMTNTDDFWYCPFAYNYSNYSRSGYSKNILTYTDVVSLNGVKLRTTLGGTGIAVSAYSKAKESALRFVEFICSPEWQAGEYVYHGGQPGYDYAWNNDVVNGMSNNFFRNTLPVLNNAFLRPRYNGYLKFQDEGGNYIHEYLQRSTISEKVVLEQLNSLYKTSLKNL